MTALRGAPVEEQMQPRRHEAHEEARRRFATETQRHRAATRRTPPLAAARRAKNGRNASQQISSACVPVVLRAPACRPALPADVRRVAVRQRALRSPCLCVSVAKKRGRDCSVTALTTTGVASIVVGYFFFVFLRAFVVSWSRQRYRCAGIGRNSDGGSARCVKRAA